MKFGFISAKNFRALRDVQLSLRRPPGLYFMTGRNLDRPKLGANGVGKSSLWQAMYWNQYGVTPDGLKALTLAGAAREGYSVTVELDGTRLRRTWNPNELTISAGKTERVVSSFDDYAVLDPAEFQACVFACQGGDTLLDYGPAKRLELVSSVLRLDDWNELSARAKEFASVREARASGFAREIEVLKAQLRTLRDSAPTKEIAHFEELRRIRIKRERKLIKEEMWKLVSLKTDVATRERNHKADLQRLSGLSQKIFDATINLKACEKDNQQHVQALMRAEGLLATEKELQKKLQESDAECEVCGSELDTAHRSKRLELMRIRIAHLQQERDKQWQQIRTAEGAKEHFQGKLDNAKKAHDDLKTSVGNEQHKMELRIMEIGLTRARRSEAIARLKTARTEDSPFVASELKRKKKIRQVKADLEAYASKEMLATRAAARAAWWVNGFKDIRYEMLETALAELTTVAQAQLYQFGMTGFKMEFIAEREKKDGGMSNTFDVLIAAPGRRKHSPLASFSGGEQSCLKLSSAFSLSDFLLRRKGISCNIEVYDEPTQHLSPQAIESVVELLKARAQASGKQIWLVDHNAINSTAFMSTVMLELKNGTTRVVE